MYNSICPIFPSSNFKRTTDFFQTLGFLLAYEYEEEGYLILVQDQVELHFFRAKSVNPEETNYGAFVRVSDANALSKRYAKLGMPTEGIPRVWPAEDKPWGICELGIVDPDGNLLRVGHILE